MKLVKGYERYLFSSAQGKGARICVEFYPGRIYFIIRPYPKCQYDIGEIKVDRAGRTMARFGDLVSMAWQREEALWYIFNTLEEQNKEE